MANINSDYNMDNENDSNQKQAPIPTPIPTYPNQFFSIGVIIFITMVFFMIKYTKGDSSIINYIIYGLVLIFSQLFFNLNLTNTVCGVNQWATTIFATFIPWTLIFGGLVLILNYFPGWLKPFSNTIGYMVVSLMGLNKTIDLIIPSKTGDNSNALAEIYNNTENKTLLINEIPPSSKGFENFISNLKKSKLLNPELLTLEINKILEEKNIVELKKQVILNL